MTLPVVVAALLWAGCGSDGEGPAGPPGPGPGPVTPGRFDVVGRGAMSARFTSDLWIFGTAAYTGTWRERLSGEGLRRGDVLYAWDISSPGAIRLVDSVSVDASTVNDVKIRADGSLAVLTHEGSDDGLNGITLLDTGDLLHPRPIARLTERMEFGVHNAWIEGDYVYVVVDGSAPEEGSGLQVVDVSDPANPGIVADFFGGAPGQPGQFLHDVYVRDGLAFLSHWNAGLVILDVGNGIAGGSPENPVEVSRLATAGGQTHNAWYWPEAAVVFVGEEDFGTPGVVHVVDVRDLRSPREVATWGVAGDTPHNFWVDEAAEVLYVGWYSQGLRALDVGGELQGRLGDQGRELAFSLYDGGGGCGASSGTCTWAPQLHEGLVFVSDLNSGIWALRPSFDAAP